MTNKQLQPIDKFISTLEKNEFYLLHHNIYEDSNYYIFFHKNYNTTIEFNSKKNAYDFIHPEEIMSHTQFHFNHNKEIFKTIKSLKNGTNIIEPSGEGTFIEINTYHFISIAKTLIFINALNQINKAYPNFFCKQTHYSKPILKKEFIVQEKTNDLKTIMQHSKILLSENKQLKKLYSSIILNHGHNGPSIWIRIWNDIIKLNLLATEQNELNKQDRTIIKKFVNLINSNKSYLGDYNEFNKNTSIGINIFHTIPFIDNEKITLSLLNYINNTFSDFQILNLLNSADQLGNTPILSALKQIKHLNGVSEKSTKYFIKYYANKFGNQLIVNNEKESIANIICSDNIYMNQNIFHIVAELNIEWWHLIYQKKNPDTAQEEILCAITDPLEVISIIQKKYPKEHTNKIYDQYVCQQQQKMNKTIANTKTTTRLNKI